MSFANKNINLKRFLRIFLHAFLMVLYQKRSEESAQN